MSGSLGDRPLSAAAAVVRNPLSVIALFVLLVETIATVTLVQVSDRDVIAIPLAWFVVLFPLLIASLFFVTLWRKHECLYSPMEYRSDEAFLSAMDDRLERVEVRQEAADLNPQTTDEEQSLRVVDRLVALNDIRAAVKVGRTFLEAGQHDIAVRIFSHIIEKIPLTHGDRYNALANLGYAQIGLARYEDAISSLNDCLSLIGERNGFPWHFLALAYAHFRLSKSARDAHHKQFQKNLDLAKKHRRYSENRRFFMKLYPDMAEHL